MFAKADTLPSPLPLPPNDAVLGLDSASAEPRDLSHVVDSNALLKGQKTVDILHNGLVYRLQATRLGKLILTK